ncbi:hypothetical protein Lal_00028218 [Lupinus albus]|nr:hypothetical protein Lal_00028218 [Lupinus albus]
MVTHISLLFCVSFILACTFLSKCDAGDDNPKLHIVYMGSLPKTSYSPSSHHLSMMQEVFVKNDSTNFLIHSYKRSFNGPGIVARARDCRLGEKGSPGRVKSWAILKDSRLSESCLA